MQCLINNMIISCNPMTLFHYNYVLVMKSDPDNISKTNYLSCIK